MPITINEFAKHFPRLYHVALGRPWDSIKTHGLLSATAILDRTTLSCEERKSLERKHRSLPSSVQALQLGNVILRDQKAMSPKKLAMCINGMSVEEWYAFLNTRVFFWVAKGRLEKFLVAYANEVQTVIVANSLKLLMKHGQRASLSPINSGNTYYKPAPRGPGTFQSFEDFPFEARKKSHGAKSAIAELAVDYAIRDILEFVEVVQIHKGLEVLETPFQLQTASE